MNEVKLLPCEIWVSSDHNVHFYAEDVTSIAQATNGRKYTRILARFQSRIDDRCGLVAGLDCYKRPPAFHAGIMCFASMLRGYHQDFKKEVGTQTQILPTRQLLQSYAGLYGVDPNQVAEFYHECRQWLYHDRLTHPVTLEALENNLISSQRRKMN